MNSFASNKISLTNPILRLINCQPCMKRIYAIMQEYSQKKLEFSAIKKNNILLKRRV